MRPILSKLDPRSESWRQNCDAMRAHLDRLDAATQEAMAGGGPKYQDRHQRRGKLLPRERIERLLDPGSPFLELMPFAGVGIRGVGAGAGVIGGIGHIKGVECLITASESTVKGGAINEWGLKKSLRLMEIGIENGLPSVSLIESAGADLPNQSKIFVPGGANFKLITQRSKARLPSICVVFGNATAGGAYIPGMSDYAVFIEGQAKVFLAGPPLVKMATGEVVDDESLGGARMHATKSGVADYLARDEDDGLRIARDIVGTLNWKKTAPAPRTPVVAPRYAPESLLGVVPADPKTPFDPREIIARVVDGSNFSEFKALYGPSLVCGWAELHGHPIGILANHGALFSASANKGAQFIGLCNQQGTPLLFLQNITGFMVGRRYEEEGIIKHGAKLINAVSNCEVPILTLMTGASYGAGNYGMAGRSYDPRFLFTWPNHRIAVMGGPQLAGTLELIKRESAERRGEAVNEKALETVRGMIEAQIEKESDAFFATARVWDDGVIDPRQTRNVLGIALSAALNNPGRPTTSWGVFRH